jgi:class 3 adenylate cyclase/predicted ATPase
MATTGLVLGQGPEAERRQVTVMFCDLADSTAMSEQLDPEDLGEVLRIYHSTCAAQIVRHGGYVANYMGDGVLAYFGYPSAHEDSAERAVRAGLGIVAAVTRLKLDQPVKLRVRVGLATGLAVAGDVLGPGEAKQTVVTGRIPNLAARVQTAAPPDSVAISDSTRVLLGKLFECESLGTQSLKGIQEPVRLWRVLGERTGASRFDAERAADSDSFFGRPRELSLLSELWQRAAAGAGQVVHVSGEAGVGKSRLCAEFLKTIAEDAHFVIRLQCSAHYQSTALYPVIVYIEHVAGFERGDTPETKLEKLEALLDLSSGRHTLPLFADLLSIPTQDRYPPLTLSPTEQRARLLGSLGERIVERARQQPVVVLFEDAHWIDPSTEEALGLLIDRVASTRVMLIVSYRTGFAPKWTRSSHIIEIALHPLDRAAVEQIIARIAGNRPLPAPVIAEIIARTDGVPLFVEEVTRSVVDTQTGSSAERASGEGATVPIIVPATLQDSFMARLDRMPGAKQVAQLAAALGRNFSLALLAAIAPTSGPALLHALDRLVDAQVIYRRELQNDVTFTFKHALLQDVAYQSLLKSKRQEYHASIARTLTERFPNLVEVQPELVAHHLTEAGHADEAIRYWHVAGLRAAKRSANVEAIAHFSRARSLLPRIADPGMRQDHEFDLLLALLTPLAAVTGHSSPEVEHATARAVELGKNAQDPARLLPALSITYTYHAVSGDIGKQASLAKQISRLAEAQPIDDARLMAGRAVGQVSLITGRLANARRAFEQTATLYDSSKHLASGLSFGMDHFVTALTNLGLTLWALGFPSQADVRHRKMVEHARSIKHANSQACALWGRSFLCAITRRTDLAKEESAELHMLNAKHELRMWSAAARFLDGYALAATERDEQGLDVMLQGITGLTANNIWIHRTAYLTMLAACYLSFGQPTQGLAAVEEALALIDEKGERWMHAEVWRVKGEILVKIQGSQSDNAQNCFKEAIKIAQSQEAKLLELRAAASLAGLWLARGRGYQAADLLRPVYSWFSEGYETPDLMEARALLHECESASRPRRR